MKIRTRLLITASLLMAAGLYWLVDWIVRDVRFHYFMTMEESLVDTSVILAEQISRDGLPVGKEFQDMIAGAKRRQFEALIYDHVKTNMNLRVIVVDHDTTVLYDSRGESEGEEYDWRDTRLTLKGEYGARATYETPADPDSFHFYVAAPIMLDGEIIGAVSVGKPVNSIYPFMAQARFRLVISGLIAFITILLLLIPVSLWIIHPVRALTRYARSIRDGRKAVRPVLGHGGEMSELANAFEEMRDALEGREYVEEYVQSLTHEMKSPLAAIQGAAELLDEDMPEEQRTRFLKNIRTESVRLHGLVNRMLALASIEKQKELVNSEPIDIQTLLDDVTDSLLPVLQGRKVTVQCSIDKETGLHGEYFLLRQALANLIQNAADFSPPGKIVEVRVECDGETTTFRILDQGEGIPDYARDRVFERFYSLPRPGSGTKSSGLGLNFVREIAHLHDGSVVLANRNPHGTEATLAIPRREA